MHSSELGFTISDPLPPVDQASAEGGVGPQNAREIEGSAPNNNAPQNSAPQVPSDWPAWAPPLPKETAPAPWEAEGRLPRPDEMFPAFGEPARRPSDYTMPQGFLGDDVNGEGLTHGRAVQSLLFSAGFPATEGSALLQELADAERMNPGEPDDLTFLQQTKQTELTLRRKLGDAEFERRRAALTEMLADMDRKSGGKLGDFIEERAHHLASPMVYARLLAHAGRLGKRGR